MGVCFSNCFLVQMFNVKSYPSLLNVQSQSNSVLIYFEKNDRHDNIMTYLSQEIALPLPIKENRTRKYSLNL